MMNEGPNPVVFSVQTAVLDLLELVDHISQDENPEKQEELRQEVQKTVLMLIAAVILANRQYEPTRWSFLSNLVDWRDLPGGEVRYLNEYATRWVEASKSAPQFFETAIQYDSNHHTGIARGMLRQIQLIGNTICGSDGSVSAMELATVKHYIEFLEEKIHALTSQEVSERLAKTVLSEVIQDSAPQELPLPSDQLNFVIVSKLKDYTLRWVSPNESVTVGSYTIPGGMIYVSNGQPTIDEASAINIRLPIGNPRVYAPLNYYPQYRWITADQHAVYLEWLAGGRKDENPEMRELGYVFLFFYGLERRLLMDKSQEQEVVAEIVRLLQHYGP